MRDNIFALHVDCVIILDFYVNISGRFGSCEGVESERIWNEKQSTHYHQNSMLLLLKLALIHAKAPPTMNNHTNKLSCWYIEQRNYVIKSGSLV